MSKISDISGGPVAIRGYIVQTLVALFQIAQADPPFTWITMEPAHADDQFDFIWCDGRATNAVQVKSTINEFSKPDVEAWAKKMEAARKGENCRLMLVGRCHRKLNNLSQIGSVAVERQPLNDTLLFLSAANYVAHFLQAQKLDAGTPQLRGMIVEGLITRLLRHSVTREPISHSQFVDYLRQWIEEAPRPERKIDIAHIARYAPAKLIGRETETQLIVDAWNCAMRGETQRPNVLNFVALGGEGKTSLVAKWTATMAHQHWPGCEIAFAWSFYSQGTREQTAVSSDMFLAEALAFFGDATMAASAASSYDKGRRLAQLVGERRSLLILDGLEPLQYAPTSPTPGKLKDQGVASLLIGLSAISHGLCVVTTRYALPNLSAFLGRTVREESLTRLSRAAGVQLLKAHCVTGSDRRNIPLKGDDGRSEDVSEFEKLVEDVDGHALTLHIMGSFLKKAFRGDIRYRNRVTFAKASLKTDNDHAFRAMAAYAKWMEDGGDEAKRELAILHLMGFFDRPATADCLDALLDSTAIPDITEPILGLPEEDWNYCLDSLESAKLITVNRGVSSLHPSHLIHTASIDAHPLIREYFALRVRTQQPDSWRAAHRRLYEHLSTITHEGDQPTLEALQPLYQAVAHGCHAGLLSETCAQVYIARILKGDLNYSTFRLGAVGSDLGAVACFFDFPWDRVSELLNPDDQAWLLTEAAFSLRSLGRLIEALQPMQGGLAMAIQGEDWGEAARRASNLSELQLTLGEIESAVRTADLSVTYSDMVTKHNLANLSIRREHSVTLADRSNDIDWQDFIRTRTSHAHALHQSGRHVEAHARLSEAEVIQARYQPSHPILYSVWGYRYCDVLIAASEQAAWLKFCNEGALSPEEIVITHNLRMRSISERADQTLRWADEINASLLGIALSHLTLGRVALYTMILSTSVNQREDEVIVNLNENQNLLSKATAEISAAVTGLRRTGQQDYTPCGLLSRAWLRFLAGAYIGPESAQADLDEAWEIAERGPMKLFLADIHLFRARLFGSRIEGAVYPWTSPQHDLASARLLIEQCGYRRRQVELENAEAVLNRRFSDHVI